MNWRGHDDVMQIRSIRGSGEPAWVIALPSAGKRLGPDPRRALGPAAIRAASTGRTRDRTRPMLQKRQKVLARAPSTRDPTETLWAPDFKTIGINPGPGPSVRRTKGVEFHQNIHSRVCILRHEPHAEATLRARRGNGSARHDGSVTLPSSLPRLVVLG